MLFTCIFGRSRFFGSQERADCNISSTHLTCLEGMREHRPDTMCLQPSATPSRLGPPSGNAERRRKRSFPATACWPSGALAKCPWPEAGALHKQGVLLPGACLSNAPAQAARTRKVIVPAPAVNKLCRATDAGGEGPAVTRIWVLGGTIVSQTLLSGASVSSHSFWGWDACSGWLWGLLRGSAPDAPGLTAAVGRSGASSSRGRGLQVRGGRGRAGCRMETTAEGLPAGPRSYCHCGRMDMWMRPVSFLASVKWGQFFLASSPYCWMRGTWSSSPHPDNSWCLVSTGGAPTTWVWAG